MKYPRVLSEHETIAAARTGRSISRFGDGELRLATGLGDAVTQRTRSPRLTAELQSILSAENPRCLVCIPNYEKTPRRDAWVSYSQEKYLKLFGAGTYGSSFISRPDSAPWIDVPSYWNSVRALWRGKDVVLVAGDKKSITTEMMRGEANSVKEIVAPAKEAYEKIDEIEEKIGRPAGPVIMCLGVTATCLAFRLEEKGVHGLDLGHIGMFMRHAGMYRYREDDLTSARYREQLRGLHKKTKWGNDGKKRAPEVLRFWQQLKAKSILDYGCGRGSLAKVLAPIRVMEYDPGVIGKEKMPKPADLVVCTDVLEHVEPEKIDAVLDHIHKIATKGAFLLIATRPANAILPDGRNAHLIIENSEFWVKKISALGWKSVDYVHDDRAITFKLVK